MEGKCLHLLPVSSALPGVFISYPVCALEHGWMVRKPVPLEAGACVRRGGRAGNAAGGGCSLALGRTVRLGSTCQARSQSRVSQANRLGVGGRLVIF